MANSHVSALLYEGRRGTEGARLHGLLRRATGPHANLWDLPTAELSPADADAPAQCEAPDVVAALRGAFVEAGVLHVDGSPGEVDVAALRRAYAEGPRAGHAELGRRGLRWRNEAAERLGVAGGRGDVDAVPRQLIAVPAGDGGGRRGEVVAQLEERWAKGALHLTPVAATGLRWAIDGVGASGHGDWEVAPGVRMLPLDTPTLPPATHTNCFLLGTAEAVLVEPASPHEREIEHVVDWVEVARARGVELKAILTTHHHPDHVGGATALSERLGVPLWAHRETARRLSGAVSFDRELVDGERIELAGPRELTIQAVHTPGHAPGHLCFEVAESRALIAGDMVAGVGTILVEPTDGDMSLYLASLRVMAAREPSMVLPAHGGLLSEPQAFLEHYIAHRLAREAKVRAALRGHRSPARADELVPVAYADAPKAVWPMAALSVESHLRKLRDDGEAHCEAGRWTPMSS